MCSSTQVYSTTHQQPHHLRYESRYWLVCQLKIYAIYPNLQQNLIKLPSRSQGWNIFGTIFHTIYFYQPILNSAFKFVIKVMLHICCHFGFLKLPISLAKADYFSDLDIEFINFLLKARLGIDVLPFQVV